MPFREAVAGLRRKLARIYFRLSLTRLAMLQFSRTNAIYAPLIMTLILSGCDVTGQTPGGSEAVETERTELEQRISANPDDTALQLRLLDLEIDQGGPQAIELLERILNPDAKSAFPTFIGKGAMKNETRFADEYDLAYRLMRLYERAGQLKKLHALALRIAQPATTDNRFSRPDFERGRHPWRSKTQVTGNAAIAIALQHADTAAKMSELKTALENSPWRASRNQLHRRMNPPDDQELKAIGWANVSDGVQLIASSNNVLSLTNDAEHIYSGHPWGVAVYDHSGDPVTRIALGAAARVLTTSHDCVWVGTPAGLFRIVCQDWSVAHQDLQGDIQRAWRMRSTGGPIADRWIYSSVWDLAVDGDSLWIGTQRNVQRLNMRTLQLQSFSQSELGTRQWLEFDRIEVDEKYVWACGSSVGIRRYDRATGTWAAPDSIGPRAPVQLVDIVDGRVFGDVYPDDTRRHRLCVIDPISMSVTLIPFAKDDESKVVGQPMNFNGKQNGRLVFGGYRFDAETNQMVTRTDFKRESAADRDGDSPARKLRKPSHAYIFSLYDKIDQSLRRQRRPTLRDGVAVDLPDGRRILGLRQNAIRYQYPREDIPESNVPYDTRPGGLFVVDEDVTEISAVPASDAIPGGLVRSIGFGQGEAWACTSAGIATLDQNNHVRTTFTRRDGLSSDSVTGATEKFGKWYFSTSGGRIQGGLAIFDPKTTIFTSLTTLDGLALNSIHSIRSKEDQLELTFGHERRQVPFTSDLNRRTFPPQSFDPRTNRLGPIGAPIFINERSAMSQESKETRYGSPFLAATRFKNCSTAATRIYVAREVS